jgi:glutamine---fructose-6-phosphate transaminase (isomerizing)
MCGILGVLTADGSPLRGRPLWRTVAALLSLSESRGMESSGIAVEADDAVHLLRGPQSATGLTRSRSYREIVAHADRAARGLCVIGHTRMATNGTPADNHNNQPLVSRILVGVHNGIITNDRDLVPAGAPPLVDSAALFDLLERLQVELGAVAPATAQLYARIEGMASIAAYFLEPRQLLLATNNGSLYTFHDEELGAFVFASEGLFLRRALSRWPRAVPHVPVRQLQAGVACIVRCGTLETERLSLRGVGADARARRSTPTGGRAVRVIDYSSYPPVPGRRVAGGRRDAAPRGTLDVEFEPERGLRRCTRCILPETMPRIDLDARGVCRFCREHRPLEVRGEAALRDLVRPYRGDGSRPDCVVAISGGRDSSYTLHYVKQVLGMNPVAFTYDWGMMTDEGRRNVSRLCAGTGTEHILVSADIPRKRAYIRANVSAWLRRPHLGTVPLFMAGDKQFYRISYVIQRQFGAKLMFYGEHALESTNFKVGYGGARLTRKGTMAYSIPTVDKLKMLLFYGREYLLNTAYLNGSLWDSLDAFASFYLLPHDYLKLYDYVAWDEATVVDTLRSGYHWEAARDSGSTWRIDDGTAAFYNYIYFTVGGFSEHDTFLSNLVREGRLTRAEALAQSAVWNRPRVESLLWYGETIGLDMQDAVRTINRIPKLR